MAFITDTVLKGRLADLLKVDSSALSTYWDSIVADSNESAYNEIVSRLAARGFTLAQINAWDRRTEFNKDIGL